MTPHQAKIPDIRRAKMRVKFREAV